MQKNSIFYKIKDVLRIAAEKPGDIDAIAKEVNENSNAFFYYKRISDTEVSQAKCSVSAVKKTIDFCIDLKLLENRDDCRLTGTGITANQSDKYEAQLRSSILTFLEKNSITYDSIANCIKSAAVPDYESIARGMNVSVGTDRFRTCLFLLSNCGESDGTNVLYGYRKKLYLTKELFDKLKKDDRNVRS